MRCSDLMKSDVACVTPLTTVQEAGRLMRERNIGFLPVCGAAGEPLGAITDRDLATRVCAEGLSSKTLVREIMTDGTVACRATDPLTLAERLMSGHRISRVMVTDDSGVLVGVISLSDVLEVDNDRRAARTIRSVVQREVHAS